MHLGMVLSLKIYIRSVDDVKMVKLCVTCYRELAALAAVSHT